MSARVGVREGDALDSAAMADRYLCVHCDVRFDHDPEQALRCPKCMRKTGLEKVEVTPPTKRASYVVPAVVVGAVALAALGYVLYTKDGGDAQVALAPLDAERLARQAQEVGLGETELAHLFDADDALRAFAADAVRGKASPEEKARAVVAKLRGFARESRFVRADMHTPRDTMLLTASRALAAMRPNARMAAYSLEVASIAVAALRAEGVDAMLAEVFTYRGERKPTDPSGRVGYYAVAVYPDDVGEGDPLVLDAFGARDVEPTSDGYRVLTDVEALSGALAIEALHLLVHEGDVAGAMERAQAATTLDPRSPTARCVRAAVLISSGGIDEGEAELRAASEIRPDAPRQANLAGVYIATNRTAEATRAVDRALEAAPDYVYAIALRGAIHLARNETAEAKTSLERAEALERDFYMLPMLWAEYFLRTNDPMSAVARAQSAIERRPRDYQTLFSAARVFQAADQRGLALETARRALELVPADQRDALRARFEGFLGAGALSEGEGAGGASSFGSGGALDLSRGSRLLGGGGATGPSGPSLLGGQGLRLGGGTSGE